jgi:hypothetical protein
MANSPSHGLNAKDAQAVRIKLAGYKLLISEADNGALFPAIGLMAFSSRDEGEIRNGRRGSGY